MQCICVLFLFLISFGNVLVLIAVYRFEKLRTITNIFLTSLAIGDLLVGFINMPLLFIYVYEEVYLRYMHRNKWFCLISNFLFNTLFITAFMNLLAVSIERYIAIVHPFCYTSHATKRKAIYSTIAIWVTTSVFNAIPMFGWNTWSDRGLCPNSVPFEYSFLSNIFLSLVIVITTYIYLRICCVVWKHHKMISDQNSNLGIYAGNVSQKEIENRRRSFKMLATVVCVFYTCWGLHIVVYWGNVIFRLAAKYEYEYALPMWFLTATRINAIIAACNSWINPCIYCGMNREFREAFIKILWRK